MSIVCTALVYLVPVSTTPQSPNHRIYLFCTACKITLPQWQVRPTARQSEASPRAIWQRQAPLNRPQFSKLLILLHTRGSLLAVCKISKIPEPRCSGGRIKTVVDVARSYRYKQQTPLKQLDIQGITNNARANKRLLLCHCAPKLHNLTN